MFATDKEAYEAVQQAQRDQGFTTSKRRLTGSARHGRNVRIDMWCHRSGKYRPWDKKQEKYKTHTQKLECPFHVIMAWKPELARQIAEEYPEVQIVDQDVWLLLRRLRLQQYEPHTSAQAFLRILKQD
ncbi:hypothetical protein QQZ08_007720 [Neonectria magnoliae]|uniref:Uncharacterized protein n=1 Tax=Neonectria magnoliae TaxID=2732573 RepID=A0ABR1HWW1_9HYPO